MNEQHESKSLGRLIANLESDPDIQSAIQSKRIAQGQGIEDSTIKPLKERVFEIVQDALACYEEQNKSATLAFVEQTISSVSFRLREFLTACALKPAAAMGAQAQIHEERAEATIEFNALKTRYGLSPAITVNILRRGAITDVTFVLHSEDTTTRTTGPVQVEWVRIGKKNKRSLQVLEFPPEFFRAEARILDAKNAEEWVFSVK